MICLPFIVAFPIVGPEQSIEKGTLSFWSASLFCGLDSLKLASKEGEADKNHVEHRAGKDGEKEIFSPLLQ